MQQILADRITFPRTTSYLGSGIAVVPRAEQPDRDHLRGDPVGVLSRGEWLQIESEVPREFVIILQGILILSVVITYQIAKRRLAARQLQRAGEVGSLEDSAAEEDIEGLAKEDR
jgi:hypothetical protein